MFYPVIRYCAQGLMWMAGISWRIAIRGTVGSFVFVALFIGLFIILLLTTVSDNLWFFGLKDGKGIKNEAERQFTRLYKEEFDIYSEQLLQPIDDMKDVTLAYRVQLKQLIKSNAAIGIGVARVLSFAKSRATEDSLPDPKTIMAALAPKYSYKTINSDTGKRRYTEKETHSIAHGGNKQQLTVSTYTLSPHEVMDWIDVPAGKIRLIYVKKGYGWKTISEESDEQAHQVYVDGKKAECKFTVYKKVEEQEIRTLVDDSLPPVLMEKEGKLDATLYSLGMKSEKDIKLVREIALLVKDQMNPGNVDYKPGCRPCEPPPNLSALEWYWPLPGYTYISSYYGPRWGDFHYGIDIPAPIGASVVAPLDGVVAYAGPASGYGNVIYLNHGQGLQTRYGHMSRVWVSTGDKVRKGERIASNGNEGRSTGAHLHFEIRTGVKMNNQFSRTVPSKDPGEVYAIAIRKKANRR